MPLDLLGAFPLLFWGIHLVHGTSLRSVRSVGDSMALLNRMLIIVAHSHQAQYTYLKHAFEKEAMDVIFDRRAGERRQLAAMDRARSERRRGRDRRQRDITKDLERFGWAI